MSQLEQINIALTSHELKVANEIYRYWKYAKWDLTQRVGKYDIRDIIEYYDCGFKNEIYKFKTLVTKVVDPYNYVIEFFPTNYMSENIENNTDGIKFITLNGEPIFILVSDIFNNERTNITLVGISDGDIKCKLEECEYPKEIKKDGTRVVQFSMLNTYQVEVDLKYFYKKYLYEKANNICKESGEKWKLLDSTIESESLFNGKLNIYVKQKENGTKDLLLDISRIKLCKDIDYYVNDSFDIDIEKLQKEIYETAKNCLLTYENQCFSECMIVNIFCKHTGTYDKLYIDLRYDSIFNIIGKLFPYMIWDQDKILVTCNTYLTTKREGPIIIYIQGLRIREQAGKCHFYIGDNTNKNNMGSVSSYATELEITYWKDNLSLKTGTKGPIINKKSINNKNGAFGDNYTYKENLVRNKVLREAELQGLDIDNVMFDCVVNYVGSLAVRNREGKEENLTNQLTITSIACNKEASTIDTEISEHVVGCIHTLEEANISMVVITAGDR